MSAPDDLQILNERVKRVASLIGAEPFHAERSEGGGRLSSGGWRQVVFTLPEPWLLLFFHYKLYEDACPGHAVPPHDDAARRIFQALDDNGILDPR